MLGEQIKENRTAILAEKADGWIRPFVEPGPQMANLLQGLQRRNVAVDYIEKILAAFRDDKQVVGPQAADHPSGCRTRRLLKSFLFRMEPSNHT